jgi:3'-phosphoadenosine 5'-phosphosulfate synthase
MVYAGPTEVQFHAKSRRCAGASYFVVGRDPAGMKGSLNAVAHADDDLYDGDHGRYVLQYSPGIGDMQFLSFVNVKYDITDNVMKIPDPKRPDDFISISGTKMRTLAQNGAVLCSKTDIPTDLVKANCVPSGFMVPKGWDIVVDYYKNAEDASRWIPWSQPRIDAPADKQTTSTGIFGTTDFILKSTVYDSWWHDLPLLTGKSNKTVVNMVVEIPKYMTAKMEMQKKLPGNPISQDTNSDGSPRYYKYGTPFFNYGFLPQTWEDPNLKTGGYGGDNDPLDVMEIGSSETTPPLAMGSITPCKVLGSLELIDQGETDHKVICIAVSDSKASKIKSIEDLEKYRPGIIDRLRDWLTRYKTADGKGENSLAEETPKTVERTLDVIAKTHDRWKSLCAQEGDEPRRLSVSKTAGFWLDSKGCGGRRE